VSIPNDLDPGIRLVVEWLNAHGFTTTDSGDGATKAEAIAEGEAMPFPHVAIRATGHSLISETWRLIHLLAGEKLHLVPFGTDDTKPSIQSTYDPGDGSAIILLTGVRDSDLRRPS
jgi:hypothetical protein